MSEIKRIEEKEVPEDYRHLINFDNQWKLEVFTKHREKKNRAVVQTQCKICKEWRPIAINDIRNFCRGTRPTFPGTHRECKYEGKYINADGYHFIWNPEHPNALNHKYVAAHIFAMSEHLGRPIDTKKESVHHINGDKSNNDISNLQLRTRYHGKGQAWECKDCGSHNVVAVELKDVTIK